MDDRSNRGVVTTSCGDDAGEVHELPSLRAHLDGAIDGTELLGNRHLETLCFIVPPSDKKSSSPSNARAMSPLL